MIPFDDSGAFRPVAEPLELRHLAVRGAAATVSAAGLSLALRVFPTVILARLLTPADFGVVTMVTTFMLLLLSFGTSGFSEAIIQPTAINRAQASNLFWTACIIGVVLTIGFAGSGPLLARFFRNPLVARATTATSVVIFISSLSVIHLALLRRGMRFAAVSANDVVALVVYTVIAILLAMRGWGYWALVGGYVAQFLSTTIGAWWLCRWIPSLPRREPGTSTLLRFAAQVYGRFSVNYFTRNFDNVLVGWQFNASALGFYKKAYDLFALSASQLTAPLNDVALAALSRLNHDRDLFKRHLVNSLGIVAFIGMAVGADLTLVGKDVVRLLLGSKWAESGRIFELFGPGIGIMLLYNTVGWIHLSIGKPGRWLRWTVFETIATVSLFVLGLRWGPAGIALAWSVSFWILTIPAFWYAGRPIGFDVSSLIAAVWRYAAASLLAGLGTAAMVRGTSFWGTPADAKTALGAMMVVSAMFIALYLGAVLFFHGGWTPLHQLLRLLREIMPSRRNTRPATEAV